MHEIRLTPKTEIDARIRHLQAQLAEEGVDAALIIHHTNMFYYSSTSQSGHLLIPRQGEPLLMVRRSFGRARAESPLAQILDVQSLKLRSISITVTLACSRTPNLSTSPC